MCACTLALCSPVQALATQCRFIKAHYLSGMVAETFVTHLLKRRQELIVHNLHSVQGAHKYTPSLSAADAGEEQSPASPVGQEHTAH